MSDCHAYQFNGTDCGRRNCAACSCAMAIAFAGGPCLSGVQIRRDSGISCTPGVDTNSGGLRIVDVIRVASLYGVSINYGDFGSWPTTALRYRLDVGQGAIILGEAHAAPIQPTTGFVYHSGFVHGHDSSDRTHWHDPRLTSPAWVPVDDVIRYWSASPDGWRYAGFVAPNQVEQLPDTSTGGPVTVMPGLKLTDASSFAGTIDIRSGAPFYPLVLDGVAGGTLGAVSKRAYCQAYSPKLNKRLFVIGDELAGVDVQDVIEAHPDVPAQPGAPITLGPGTYRVP